MYRIRFGVVFVLLLLVMVLSRTAVANTPNPQVLPPDSKAYGKTLGEWSAAWSSVGHPAATHSRNNNFKKRTALPK